MKQILLIAFMAITLKSMAFEIKTSIIINATPQEIWSVFSDFKNFGTWNTFITEVSGEIKEGNRIKVIVDGMKFKPDVLVYSEFNEFKWKGKLLFKGIFDGTHQFLIIDNLDGTTTFQQNECFSGILVPLFKKKLSTEIRSKFEKLNLDLKNRVEAN